MLWWLLVRSGQEGARGKWRRNLQEAHTWVTEGLDWSEKCVDLVTAGILIFLPTSRVHTSYSVFVKFWSRMTWIIFSINFGKKNLPLLGNLNLKNNTAPEDWLRLWNSQITSKLAGTEFFTSFLFFFALNFVMWPQWWPSQNRFHLDWRHICKGTLKRQPVERTVPTTLSPKKEKIGWNLMILLKRSEFVAEYSLFKNSVPFYWIFAPKENKFSHHLNNNKWFIV